MTTVTVKLTFTEGVLGTRPDDKTLEEAYVNNQRVEGPAADEQAGLGAAGGLEEGEEPRGRCCFPRDPVSHRPGLYDYQIKGFFKDACGALRRVPGTLSSDIKAYKQVIDGIIFVEPRFIVFESLDKTADCIRTLRTATPKGERVALVCSEEAPAGATLTLSIRLLDDRLFPLLEEWLDYGGLKGIGGWRNSGKGRFSFETLSAVSDKKGKKGKPEEVRA